jgi:DNA replicative helicase MCM subunit Mcm2 (Cdc46/Mcm family)
MQKCGFCAVRGKIMVCSGHFKMVSHTTYQCSNSKCNYHATLRHLRPLIFAPDKEVNSKCPKCLKSTASANFVFTNAIWVELQDVDMPNEIDRMIVYLFEENTKSLKVGETVVIDGNICVIHKNENYRNKFISVLFGNSIRYQNRQDISLSKQDIQQIHTLREKYGDGWLEYLVSQFAPNIAGDYYYPGRFFIL